MSHPGTASPKPTGPTLRRGGGAGWYRVAAVCAVFAALEMASSAWVTWRSAPRAGEVAHPELAPYMACSALLLLAAALFATRRQAVAGLLIVHGYATSAASLFIAIGVFAGPSPLMLVAMFALLVPVMKRALPSDPPA